MSDQPTGEWTPLSVAQHFHNIYERLAPEFGYETRTDTRHFNPETPNGKLMIAVCSEILRDFTSALAVERQRADDSILENVRLLNRLAIEREKAQAWENHKGECANGKIAIERGIEIQQLREQLAAERQKVETLMADGISERGWSNHLRIQLAAEVEKANRLQQQLAAEREKVQPLVELLMMLEYDDAGCPLSWPTQMAVADALAKVKGGK